MGEVSILALGSIFIGLLVLLLKALAFALTGSVALYSDALESIINVVTAVAAFLAVRVSARPADRNHPYGHTKVEYFSVILEGVCIVLAAVSILREAWVSLHAPHVVTAPLGGLLVNGLGTAVNAGWGLMLMRTGRSARSPALLADARHLFVDVLTSLAVLAGVVLLVLTGSLIVDPIVAALVALNILWSGWSVMRSSFAGLMDEALPAEQLDIIQSVLAINSGGTIEIHDLKTRAAGRVTFIDFHLVVESDMTVAVSHGICDQLERALRRAVPDASISIHVEPAHKAKQTGDMIMS